MKDLPLINILIRTSNRPKSFARCIQSVLQSGYENLKILVSADNSGTEEYVRGQGFNPTRVIRNNNPLLTAPYNLYLNDLLKQVKTGWILILDDDDMLVPGSLKELGGVIANADPDKIPVIITRMQWPNGRVIPEQEYWTKAPERKHIGMPCVVFHHKLIPQVKFDGMKAGDYRLARILWNARYGHCFFDKILVNVGNTGNMGRPNDIGNA
jgi:glycosyltransferase involved in cell wall biosynthesis